MSWPDQVERLGGALEGRYAVERELGAGGMATVYLAHDLKHDRPVALKVLRPELAAVLGGERFLREIRITARLSHPHILPLLDSGCTGAQAHRGTEGPVEFLYYVMPYVEGESLRQRLEREGPLPLEDALALTAQVASALDYAHQQGVIHRDIKPENVLLSKGEAVVADFGIALAVRAAGGDRLTETGLSLGTPQYMSPEQASGAREVDARSDVYSLGAVLYEMLVGEPPHTGPTVEAVLAKLLTQTPVPPRVLRAALPEPVSAAVLKALAKQAVDRFASAGEFVAALAAPAESAAEKSIVVLPFENLSPDPDNAFFADGLTEETITALSKVRALRVISRTSAMHFKGTKRQLPEIARELNVRYVLEGSVRRAGTDLRITAQLIDGSTDAHLWAERYAGTLDDVFDLQERLARNIVDALQVKLDAGTSARLAERPIASVAAYDGYLRSIQAMWEFSEPGLARAVQHLERALSLEGRNPLLLGALGYVFWQHANLGLEPADEYRERARRFAVQAFELDPQQPLAHLTIGLLRAFEAPSEGIRSFKRALAVDPANVEAAVWLAIVVGTSWRADEGRRFWGQVKALDPLHPLIWWDGWLSIMEGRFERAVEELRERLGTSPTAMVKWSLALALAYQGQREEACTLLDEAIREDPRNVLMRIGAAFRHVLAGERERALQILRTDLDVASATRRDLGWSLYVAECHALLGDTEGALDWVERCVSLGMINYPFLSRHDPFLAPLRAEARFQELMVRVKHAWETFEV